ncbi:MAG: hypothetical protein KDD11_08190 [Acidobacteria bacterium]|nr:hypothetical protein [Acidobacteriota bacterium]
MERNHGEGWNGYRLCLFGVPVDIVDARYFPSHGHSHQTLEQGVFSAPLERGDELSDAEMILTGRNRVEPLVGGISIGSTIGQAGTLGAIVWDRTDGRPCILSNWHVMAGTVDAGVGEPVYQPSFFDGGQSDDVVAHLKRWHLADLGDAAIAELNGEREYASGEILGMWHPISGTKSPELKMEVIKWGRSTGFTEGFIDGIDLATNLDYGGGVIRYFRHQFHISPLFRGKDVSQVGDSGALVLTAVNTDRLGSDLCSAKKRTWSVEASRRELLEDKDFWKKCRKYWQEASKDGGKASFEKIAKRAHDELDEERRSLADGTPDTVRSQKPDQGKNHIIEEELLDRIYGDFPDSTQEVLEWLGADIEFWERRKKLAEYHSVRRVYYAVGLIFAGDTPGSPFGEFALASDISLLEKAMQFSLRPVFEPRSSFRKLRTIERGGHRRRRGRGRGRLLEPGAERGDDRPEGPQPDPEPIQTGGG